MTPRKSDSSDLPTSNTGRTRPPSLTAVADDDTLERVFGALANETRRGILAVLHDSGEPLRSGDIAARFDIPWQAVSRHLRVLTQAGLIRCQVLTNGRLYSLDRERLRRVAGRWIARVATEGKKTADGKVVFDFTD